MSSQCDEALAIRIPRSPSSCRGENERPTWLFGITHVGADGPAHPFCSSMLLIAAWVAGDGLLLLLVERGIRDEKHPRTWIPDGSAPAFHLRDNLAAFERVACDAARFVAR